MLLEINSQTLTTLFLMKFLSDIQIDYSFLNFQFFAEGNMFQTGKNKSGSSLILYVSDSIPGKLINTYHFIKTSENIDLNLVYQMKNFCY